MQLKKKKLAFVRVPLLTTPIYCISACFTTLVSFFNHFIDERSKDEHDDQNVFESNCI